VQPQLVVSLLLNFQCPRYGTVYLGTTSTAAAYGVCGVLVSCPITAVQRGSTCCCTHWHRYCQVMVLAAYCGCPGVSSSIGRQQHQGGSRGGARGPPGIIRRQTLEHLCCSVAFLTACLCPCCCHPSHYCSQPNGGASGGDTWDSHGIGWACWGSVHAVTVVNAQLVVSTTVHASAIAAADQHLLMLLLRLSCRCIRSRRWAVSRWATIA